MKMRCTKKYLTSDKETPWKKHSDTNVFVFLKGRFKTNIQNEPKRDPEKAIIQTKFKMGLSYEPPDHAEGFSSFYRLASMYGIFTNNYICDLCDKYG